MFNITGQQLNSQDFNLVFYRVFLCICLFLFALIRLLFFWKRLLWTQTRQQYGKPLDSAFRLHSINRNWPGIWSYHIFSKRYLFLQLLILCSLGLSINRHRIFDGLGIKQIRASDSGLLPQVGVPVPHGPPATRPHSPAVFCLFLNRGMHLHRSFSASAWRPCSLDEWVDGTQ